MRKQKKVQLLLFLFPIFLYQIKFIPNTIISTNNKNIFTFWEPIEKIPGYLKLCMKT